MPDQSDDGGYLRARERLLAGSRITTLRERYDLFPYVLISGVAFLIAVVYFYPLYRTFVFAFTDSTFQERGEFVGLQHFAEIFNNGFLEVLVTTAYWTFGAVSLAMLLGMGGALLMNRDFWGRKYFMGMILAPWAMPLAIAGFLWLTMFIGEYGFINKVILDPIPGYEPISFLGHDHALKSVIVARVWKAAPFALIIYYARLKAIPDHYYDAAKIDGAGKWAQFRYITLPELRQVSVIIVIVLTVWTTLIFDIVYVMTGGGPAGQTRILPVDIYVTMFGEASPALASAKAVTAVFFLSIVTVIYWKVGDL
ncbi:carbohydrate ABC transporter permease [Halobium palmae]|uniref:Carbohydrate ABC transporter permease n=1 Tax=Halobium palmae TaxID=1776492 RepID=A0ABD5RWG3_9EURY